MPFSNAAMVVGCNAIRSAIGGLKLHADNPGAGGASNASSAAMVVPAWTVVTGDGDFDLASPASFTGCAPSGAITWVSLWSNTSGSGIWYGNVALSGDLTADALGNFTVDELTVNGAST